MEPIAFVYCVLLVLGLVRVADWLAPYENLTEDGCTVAYVYDGDTVSLICDREEQTARLVGFDTPEAKKPGCRSEARLAAAATERLRALVASGSVMLSGDARDKYGRLLVTLKVDGKDVGDTLISEGFAVAYTGGKRITWCDRLEGS